MTVEESVSRQNCGAIKNAELYGFLKISGIFV